MRIGTRVQRGHTEWQDDVGYVDVPDGGPVGTVIAVEESDHYDHMVLKSLTVRWDTGALETLPSEPAVDDGPCICDILDVTPRLYVNVYLHDRRYGGCEEGGWWYDEYWPDEDQCVLAASLEAVEGEAARAQAWCDTENADRRSDIGSVCSEGRYEVAVEAWPAEHSPACRPHYC